MAQPGGRLDQDASPYADALREYADRGRERFTTPGHQNSVDAQPLQVERLGRLALELDVPSNTDGVDRGDDNPLDRSLALAAQAWGARRTWFLTNGSSQGNQTACLALAGLGGTIVAQRSVHSSVVDGLMLSGLSAVFVAPYVDQTLGIANGVTASDVDEVLRAHPEAVAVYVVSPSYFGAVSDIAALAQVAHAHDAALVVDEAWGAHLGLHPALPVNAVRLGADVVVASMHKLAGSLSQTALLHLGHGPYADRLEPLLDRAFRSLQSTSVYAGLLASLDLARRQGAGRGGDQIGRSVVLADRLRARLAEDGRFSDVTDRITASPDVLAHDPLHVVIDTRSGGIAGHEARKLLFDDLGVHAEMATDDVLVLIWGAGAEHDPDAVADVLLALPDRGAGARHHLELPEPGRRVRTVREAWFAPSTVVTAADAVGRVSADSVAAYPPGIPNLMPGEEVTAATVAFLQAVAATPFGHVRGALDPDVSRFRVAAG